MHGAWGWEEGSNGKHFSAIEGPGSVCVWGGGEMWKYFIAIKGMWKDFISIQKVWGGACGKTLLP